MRSAFIKLALVSVGLTVGVTLTSLPRAVKSKVEPEVIIRHVAVQQPAEPESRSYQMFKHMYDDADQKAAERRAYELGQIDGEGYAEDQARSR